MWYKSILFFLLAVIAFVIQFGFLSLAGTLLSSLNLVLIFLVIILSLFDFRYALVFTLSAGLLLDIFSNLPFGIFLLTLFATIMVLEFLALNFFTNYSFYSLVILGSVAAVVYHGVFLMLGGLLYLAGFNNFFVSPGYFWLVVIQLLELIVFLSLGFWLINKFSRFFKPIFIRS